MEKNNTGEGNSGYGNSGDRNSGDWNSGYGNSGYRNSGDRNSGDWNSGNRNSGDRNSGDRNSGYRNSGGWNSGNRNSGDWNSGDRNSGYLNTDEPRVRIFNKETDIDRKDIDFPDYFYFDLCRWVSEADMTQKEKKEHEQYKVTGGYLKTSEYKKTWKEAWDNATNEDRRKTLKLPNWDNEIFEEITGIDVEAELGWVDKEAIEVDGKEFSVQTVKKALRAYLGE